MGIHVVVMGVSGCGKSSFGKRLAGRLAMPFVEGDDFHAPQSLRKMAAGIALDDADRDGWLQRLAAELAAHGDGAVLACSALKRGYRDRLRAAVPELRFVFLRIDRHAATERVRERAGRHPFPPTLVDDQFATLETPVGEPFVLDVDATAPLPPSVERAEHWLRTKRPVT